MEVVGILNLTPDSFSDGFGICTEEKQLKHARKMLEDGATIIDVGGESTKPNGEFIPAETEIDRIIKIVRVLTPVCLISVDTYKYEVAKCALENGAHIINDVSGLLIDEEKAMLVKDFNAKIVIMHNRLSNNLPHAVKSPKKYMDVISEVIHELDQQIIKAKKYGLRDDQIIIDPGIGFAKSYEDNLVILKNLHVFRRHFLKHQLLLGSSRKNFIGIITAKEPKERDYATLATTKRAFDAGFDFVRVHNTAANVDFIKMERELKV